MKINDEEMANVVMMWIGIVSVLLGACVLGLTFAICEMVLRAFGI